jgi:hypothetical protein
MSGPANQERAQPGRWFAVPTNEADQRVFAAGLYREQSELRLELAKARAAAAGRGQGKEPPPNAEAVRILGEALKEADVRVRKYETESVNLDDIRLHLQAAQKQYLAVLDELNRAEVEESSPPRVQLIARASVPQ